MPIFHDVREDPPPEEGTSSEVAVNENITSEAMQPRSDNELSRPSSSLGTQYPFTALQNPTLAYGGYLAGSGISRGEIIQRLKRAQSPVQNVCKRLVS